LVFFSLKGTEAQMSAARLIEQILTKCPKVSREEILEKLETEKRKTGDLFSDEILLRIIATEFGVNIPQNEVVTPSLSLGDLLPGLSDVTVVGRVIAVFPPKAFEGRKSGKIASLLIADQTDLSRVVLWNDKTSVIGSGEVKAGQIIRFSHGYTREDRSGKVELHIGSSGEVEINPKNVDAKDYPMVDRFATRIGEITQTYKTKKVNVIGKVEDLFPASTFRRQDSSVGKVMRFTLADETGKISIVVWNEKVDDLEKTLRKGLKLQIVNGKVKKATGEGQEVHVDAGAYVEAIAPAEEISKIADLKDGLNRVNVEGEVLINPMLRDVKTSRGEVVKLAVFELKDETGRIWVSAWRNHADFAKDLKTGDKVSIKNGYVKKGFADQPELSTRVSTSIAFSSRNESREQE
jgi:ssDNA-binding replication factor A large subunit